MCIQQIVYYLRIPHPFGPEEQLFYKTDIFQLINAWMKNNPWIKKTFKFLNITHFYYYILE